MELRRLCRAGALGDRRRRGQGAVSVDRRRGRRRAGAGDGAGRGPHAGRPAAEFRFEPGPALAGLVPPGGTSRRLTDDQTNTSYVVGERLVVKVYRRVEPGEHPEIEIGRFLTEHAHVAFAPAYAGAVRWGDHALAMAQAYVPDARGGWDWAIECALGGQAAPFAGLGAQTAALHAALREMGTLVAGRGRAARLARGRRPAARPRAGAGRRRRRRAAAGVGAGRPRRARRAGATGRAARPRPRARRLPRRPDPRVGRRAARGRLRGRAGRPLAERRRPGTPAPRRGRDAAVVRPSGPARRPRRAAGHDGRDRGLARPHAGGVSRRLRRPRSGAAAGARVREGDVRVRLRGHVPARLDARRRPAACAGCWSIRRERRGLPGGHPGRAGGAGASGRRLRVQVACPRSTAGGCC